MLNRDEIRTIAQNWKRSNAGTVQTAIGQLEVFLRFGYCSGLPFNYFALFAETVMTAPKGTRKEAAQIVLEVLKDPVTGERKDSQ